MNAFKSAEKLCKSYSTWDDVLSEDDLFKDPYHPQAGMTSRTVHLRGCETRVIAVDGVDDVFVVVEALDHKYVP